VICDNLKTEKKTTGEISPEVNVQPTT